MSNFFGNLLNESLSGWQAFGERVMNIFGQNSARQQNEFNAEQAQLNRDFQERMSNTSYQRAVQDMGAAGLNSALAYSQGGAYTPGGSSASSSQGGQVLVNLLGAVIGSLSTVARAAISANSASSVANIRNTGLMARTLEQVNSAHSVANIRAASAKEVANTYVNGREVRRIANILSQYDH